MSVRRSAARPASAVANSHPEPGIGTTVMPLIVAAKEESRNGVCAYRPVSVPLRNADASTGYGGIAGNGSLKESVAE